MTGWLTAACGESDAAFRSNPDGSACERNGVSCPAACDDVLGCVACLTDADCGGERPACVAGACLECGDNSDCPSGQSCFPDEHNCQDSCTEPGDCTGDAEICDTTTGVCLGCVDASDCPEGICSAVTKQCVECDSADDCGGGEPVCDVLEGRCRECLVDAHCPAGTLCREHECRPSCSSHADCGGDDPWCLLPEGTCVECLGGDDCPITAPLCDNDHECVQCVNDENCADPAQPFCDGSECVACNDNEHCDPGFQCSSHECVAQ